MKVTINTTPPPPPTTPVRVFTLELSEDEADLIRALLVEGIDWVDSGEIGAMAKKMYNKLDMAGPPLSSIIGKGNGALWPIFVRRSF